MQLMSPIAPYIFQKEICHEAKMCQWNPVKHY